jgi:hypothetical protein
MNLNQVFGMVFQEILDDTLNGLWHRKVALNRSVCSRLKRSVRLSRPATFSECVRHILTNSGQIRESVAGYIRNHLLDTIYAHEITQDSYISSLQSTSWAPEIESVCIRTNSYLIVVDSLRRSRHQMRKWLLMISIFLSFNLCKMTMQYFLHQPSVCNGYLQREARIIQSLVSIVQRTGISEEVRCWLLH